ncbi:MAG: hypothetical protein J3K34DRAFT_192036 [Monoraphidium minutum]|nr:MAG: hypothetical protein J3K34DRAFT_192036 [Monoraphidium minutum]
MLPRLAALALRKPYAASALQQACAGAVGPKAPLARMASALPLASGPGGTSSACGGSGGGRAFTSSSPALSRFSGGGGGGPSSITPLRPPRNLGLTIVPERTSVVIERFGRFHKVLGSGLHILIPVVDRIAYVHSLKELPIPIAHQTAITKDNVTISIDGMLYVRVVDPFKASYGVDSALYAVSQLAQTTMRSELGRITLDKTFEEREALNASIVRAINEASEAWGLECLRYEIRDISPPAGILNAMALQAEAERRKRASILESEGQRQAKINVAEGDKQQVILAAEAEAEAIRRRAEATAEGLRTVAAALQDGQGGAAAQLRVAEAYVDAFRGLAKETNTVLLPANLESPSAMVAQALSVFKAVDRGTAGGGGGGPAGGSGGAIPRSGAGGSSSGSNGSGRPAAAAAAGPQLGAPVMMSGSPVFSLRSE